MRITDASLIGDFLSSINRSRSRIDRLTTQLATQQRILRASDDPAGTSVLMRVNGELARVEAFAATVVKAKGLLTVTADSLDKMSTILANVRSSLSGALTADDPAVLAQLADQVDQYLALGADVANTRYDRQYLFGGSRTTTAPYVLGGDPPRYAYTGDAHSVRYQIGEGITQVVNVSGAAAFGSTGTLTLSGRLDVNAALHTTVTQTVRVADGAGTPHDVVLTAEKTDAHTWTLSAALPPGATGVSLTGGTSTLRFDPVTGALQQMTPRSPLVLTASGGGADGGEQPVTILLGGGTLREMEGDGRESRLRGEYRALSVFDALAGIRDRLRSGQSPTADDVALLTVMQDVVNQEAARAGLYSANLASADSALTARKEYLLDLRSSTQDIDLAEIALKLKQEQTMLDAALSAAANIIPHSLLNFLK